MYIVNVEGSDSFIAVDEAAICTALEDLNGGQQVTKMKYDCGAIDIEWVDDIGDTLVVSAFKQDQIYGAPEQSNAIIFLDKITIAKLESLDKMIESKEGFSREEFRDEAQDLIPTFVGQYRALKSLGIIKNEVSGLSESSSIEHGVNHSETGS